MKTATTLELLPNPWEILADQIAARVVARLKADQEALLSPQDAAAYLGRSTRFLRREVQAGNLQPHDPAAKRRPRFERTELDRWIAEHRGA